jgi:TRAP-type transport system periplasmic protein
MATPRGGGCREPFYRSHRRSHLFTGDRHVHSFKSCLLALAFGLSLTAAAIESACAHGVTIKVQHAWPLESAFHTRFLIPWTQKLEQESGGRLHFQLPAAAPKGTAAGPLFDLVKSGDADLVWSPIAAMPGRFPALEVFELPFMTSTMTGAGRALGEYMRLNDEVRIELDGMRALAVHQTTASQFHLRSRRITTPADLSGLKIATASRIERDFLAAAGAAALALPPSQMADALAKSEIDGLLVPWEMLPALEVEAALPFHTELDPNSVRLSAGVYVLAMNAGTYKSLPDDLKKMINAHSGPETSRWLAEVLEESAAAARKRALDAGSRIDVLPPDTLQKWARPRQTAIDAWLKEISTGAELLDSGRAVLTEYDSPKR